MKKLSLIALAAAGMLLGACSSNDEMVNEAPVVNPAGAGYVGISIQMPNESSNVTRANDDLVNGEIGEFTVYNAYLYLFTGSDESDAVFLKRYSLTNDFKADDKGEKDTPEAQTGVTLPGGTAVTSTSVSVCKIDKLDLGNDRLFGYVVVNAQGGLASDPAKGTPYSEFATKVLAAADNGGSLEGEIGPLGLLMTNSPISDIKGGENAPDDETLTTLVELEPENIKDNPDDAKAAPAGCIYVERAAAKVTVTDGIAEANKQITLGTGDGAQTLSFAIEGWQVINTEPSFYNARQIEKTWDSYASAFYASHLNSYRFVSYYKFDPQIGTGHTEAYRTYFAKDIQYDDDATLDYNVAGGQIKGTQTDRAWLTTSDRAFVPENTFDVEHQQRKNTTQVTLKVKFNNGGAFYTLSNDVKYYTSQNIDAKIEDIVTHLYNVSAWMTKAASVASAADMLNKTITVAIDVTLNSSTTGKNDLGYTISYKLLNSSDQEETLDATQKAALEAAETTEGKNWAEVKEEAEKEVKVSYYAGGMSYYNIRIHLSSW